MVEYLFEYNLEESKISKDTWGKYAIRYYNTDNGVIIEVGDGYRHNIRIGARYWNKILSIIRKENDEEEIEVITKGLMCNGLPEEYESTFISAVREGLIKEIEED